MVKAKIRLDDKHICSARLNQKERALHLSVNNIPKLLTSPRFVKLALSLKAATRNNAESLDISGNQETQEKPLDIKLDTNFIKGIFQK